MLQKIMLQKLIIVFVLAVVGLYIFSISSVLFSPIQTVEPSVLPSSAALSSLCPGSLKESGVPEAYFYVPDDGLPACPKWCYIDFTNKESHPFIVPQGASDLYKYDIIEKFKEDARIANGETLVKACIYIRFDPNLSPSNAKFIELPYGPGTDGYTIGTSLLKSNENGVTITDTLILYKYLKTAQNIDLLSSVDSLESGVMLLTPDRVFISDPGGESIGMTWSCPFKDEMKLISFVAAGDPPLNGNIIPASRTLAHEMVGHVAASYRENPNGTRGPNGQILVRSNYDHHNKDRVGNTLPADNIARASSETNGYGITNQQINDIKELCSWIQGQDNSPPDQSQYASGCGDGSCSVGETSAWCPQDCGSSTDPNLNNCQWVAGPNTAKVCGGVCPDPSKVCTLGGPSGNDCGCYNCGNGVVDPGEQCEQAADCPPKPGKTATCQACKCIYAGNP